MLEQAAPDFYHKTTQPDPKQICHPTLEPLGGVVQNYGSGFERGAHIQASPQRSTDLATVTKLC